MEDYDGRTPLHIAACEGHYNVVEYLLGHGATVYAKDRYGHTPLHNAVKFRWSPSMSPTVAYGHLSPASLLPPVMGTI